MLLQCSSHRVIGTVVSDRLRWRRIMQTLHVERRLDSRLPRRHKRTINIHIHLTSMGYRHEHKLLLLGYMQKLQATPTQTPLQSISNHSASVFDSDPVITLRRRAYTITMSPVAVRLFNQACPPNKTGFVANAYLMALFGGAGSLDYRYYSLKLVTISLSCKLTRMEVDYIIISVATIVLFVNSNSTIFTIAHL